MINYYCNKCVCKGIHELPQRIKSTKYDLNRIYLGGDIMTYEKIAKIANVSVSTVSKALSGSSDISSQLADKIIQIAIDCGYFKDKSKRKLDNTKNKRPLIAAICPEIISIHYTNILTSIKHYIEEKGGQLAIYIDDFDAEKRKDILRSLILQNAADAVISFSETAEPLFSRAFPILSFCKYDLSDTEISAYADIEAILLTCIEHLTALGHKKIGFIGEVKTMSKYRYYKNYLVKLGLEYCDEWAYIFDNRFEEIGYKAADKAAKSANLPTAFICAYDEIALSFMHRIKEYGFSVPDDFSVIGINDIPFASYSQVPLTTVEIYTKEQIKLAVDALFEKIFEKSSESVTIKFNHRLIVRSTTAPIQ